MNLINNQPNIYKIYLYAKSPYEAKYQYLNSKLDKVGLKNYDDPQDVYKNIEEYNPGKNHKILIAFDDMIADMISSKRLNPIVTELFIRSRKLNISLVIYH